MDLSLCYSRFYSLFPPNSSVGEGGGKGGGEGGGGDGGDGGGGEGGGGGLISGPHLGQNQPPKVTALVGKSSQMLSADAPAPLIPFTKSELSI